MVSLLTVLDNKRTQLEDLERSELEAKRLDTALDRALNRVKAIDSDGEIDHSPPLGTDVPSSMSQSLPSDSLAPPADDSSTLATSRSMNKSTSSLGFLGALSHTFHSVVDVDPESTRRSGIGKTRETIAHVMFPVTFHMLTSHIPLT